MKPIVASLEDWDSIIDYYRPNGSSKTWYLKELKKITIPLMWAKWNVFSDKNELFEKGQFINIVTPDYVRCDDIEFLPKEKIVNEHLYFIHVFSPEFFKENEKIGFSCIDEPYQKDIINGKCKICIFNIVEGYSGMDGNFDFEIVEKWRKEASFPENSVVLFTANLIGDQVIKSKNLMVKHYGVSVFERWNYEYAISEENKPNLDFKPIDSKNLFLSYNRRARSHRINFISKLIDENLFNKGLISLNKPNEGDFVGKKILESTKNILLKNSILISDEYDINSNLVNDIKRNEYERTFISIVSETLTQSNTLFVTEKTWKPIIVGHPFIILGNLHTLKYLKSRGYKTFDRWIDESYDEEKNEDVRLDMIVKELKKLSSYSIDNLIKIRKEMEEVCIYNKNHFLQEYNTNWTEKINRTLLSQIRTVWNSVTQRTI